MSSDIASWPVHLTSSRPKSTGIPTRRFSTFPYREILYDVWASILLVLQWLISWAQELTKGASTPVTAVKSQKYVTHTHNGSLSCTGYGHKRSWLAIIVISSYTCKNYILMTFLPMPQILVYIKQYSQRLQLPAYYFVLQRRTCCVSLLVTHMDNRSYHQDDNLLRRYSHSVALELAGKVTLGDYSPSLWSWDAIMVST